MVGTDLLTISTALSPDGSDEIAQLVKEGKLAADSFDNFLVDLKEIKFYLYTNEEHKTGQSVQFQTPILKQNSFWNKDKLTKFYIHGLLPSAIELTEQLIKAYFPDKEKSERASHDVNLIIVDWKRYSHYLQYFFVAKHVVPLVSIAVARMVQNLLEETVPENIHLIGHGLGAHISSDASKYLDAKIARITGLDPAGPCFEGFFAEPHITKDDAEFVDIIHTNTKIFGFGMHSTVGHVDFYPNGGAHQNGCYFFDNISNHNRSLLYYIESINSPLGFHGKICDNYINYKKGQYILKSWYEMGECCTTIIDDNGNILEGNVYLTTKSSAPYAKGHEK